VKSRRKAKGAAWPRSAEVLLHVSGLNEALTWIVTELERRAPQKSAAYWNAISRWAPTVVPVFPPTGAAGVASLSPCPDASLLMMTKVAACTT
jgi:hypothetical protein